MLFSQRTTFPLSYPTLPFLNRLRTEAGTCKDLFLQTFHSATSIFPGRETATGQCLELWRFQGQRPRQGMLFGVG